jgi:hypothetical protein
LVYNTTANGLAFSDGTNWSNIGGSSSFINTSANISAGGNVTVGNMIVPTGAGQFNGPFNESTTIQGVYVGNLNLSPRIGFFNGTAAQNWQIDNNFGSFRWYTPGVVRLSLDANGNLNIPSSSRSTSTTTGALVVSGGVGIVGNLNVGSLAIPGAEHTIIGNVSVSGAGTEYFNIAGNILAVQASFGSINSTGFINTSGNVTATGGWGGTLSSAGVLGGVPMAFFAERTSTGTAGGVMSHGNGSTTGKGLRMPYSGKLIAGTMFGANVDGTITIDAYLNGTANTSYRFSQTGALTDVGQTQNWSSAPLTFAAGDTLGWYQTAVPTTANAYNVTFFVTYN